MTSSHPFPAEAVIAGSDTDGTTIYVGRSSHGGDMLPAKLMPAKDYFAVSHNGKEIAVTEFEVWKKKYLQF